MRQQRMDMTKIIIILVCIILIVVSLLAIIVAIDVISNKNGKTAYNELDSTDKKMLKTVQAYIADNEITFNKPIAFVKNNGICRGRAYIFNVNITEHKLNYGMNGGTFATEILLPSNEYTLPTLYRCATLVPSIGSFLFPADEGQTKLCQKDVYIISYNDKMLSDGSFLTLLEKALPKAD